MTTKDLPCFSSIAIRPNDAEPAGLLFDEAWEHFKQNRLIKFLTTDWVSSFLAIGAIAGLIYLPIWTFSAAIALLAFGLLIPTAYLGWYSRFVHINRINRPLCPKCTSRIWQFCCARCREPLPALAYWLKGAFLAHCPHCEARLSCRKKSLLAYCTTCSGGFERPDILYNKPTQVIVWFANSLPERINGEWKVLAKKGSKEMLLYHTGDKHSVNFMYMCANHFWEDYPIDKHLIDQTRLLLIANDVAEPIASRMQGLFDDWTIRKTFEP